ncbi:hypothetical protein N7456_009949 [Penicillium angulare]|uniref:Uncharacterized protein n=1 Tax=Penicillium angulare TaxID=116970 RepID=A0A9W9F5N0_9EURO|nr:hypothetical protein N7456_009949 [Penicillium angulare]
MTLYFWDRPGSIKPQELVVGWFDPDLPITDYDGWVKGELIKRFPNILTEEVRFTDNFLVAKAMDTVDGKLVTRLPSTRSLTIREFTQEAGSGRVHIIILRRLKKAPEEPLSEQERLEDKIERYGKYVEWLKRRYELGIRREIDNTEERPLYMSKNFAYRTKESTRQLQDAIKEAQAMSLIQERPPDADDRGAAPMADPVADTLASSSATNTAPIDARVARKRPQSQLQGDAPRRSKRSRGGQRD